MIAKNPEDKAQVGTVITPMQAEDTWAHRTQAGWAAGWSLAMAQALMSPQNTGNRKEGEEGETQLCAWLTHTCQQKAGDKTKRSAGQTQLHHVTLLSPEASQAQSRAATQARGPRTSPEPRKRQQSGLEGGGHPAPIKRHCCFPESEDWGRINAQEEPWAEGNWEKERVVPAVSSDSQPGNP